MGICHVTSTHYKRALSVSRHFITELLYQYNTLQQSSVTSPQHIATEPFSSPQIELPSHFNTFYRVTPTHHNRTLSRQFITELSCHFNTLQEFCDVTLIHRNRALSRYFTTNKAVMLLQQYTFYSRRPNTS